MLYYMYEEEKDQYPKAPQLDRSRRALSSRWSDEGSQEGSQQEGMPRKGARMKIGDLVVCACVSGRPVGLIVERIRTLNLFNVLVSGMNVTAAFQGHQLEVINASR